MNITIYTFYIMEEHKRIDYRKLFQALWAKRKLYYYTVPITVILAIIIIFPQPRYYTCDVMLAPEGGEDMSGSSLSNLASSFGFNIGGISNDAIYPMLYPDLFESTDFLVGILNIKLKFVDIDDNLIDTDYYTYLTKYKKRNWLTKPFTDAYASIVRLISPLKDSEKRVGDASKLDPFLLSREDYKLVQKFKTILSCSVDKKTNVTTITVKDQDRIACALLADSIKSRLQVFITEYRTSKARQDMVYYSTLAEEAKAEYDKSVINYCKFADAHPRTVLESYAAKRTELENDVQMKYETYTTLIKQYEISKAKVQEKTPAFMTLKNASAPIKPAGPKRMIFTIVAFLLAIIGTTGYILRSLLI